MKIATLYRKDGKVILETDNGAIAQVATDSPQDVVVMGARLVGRPPMLAAPYGKEVPPSPHADHGRGTPEDGPEDCDCPCRSTPDQDACAAAWCGFCANVQSQGIAAPAIDLEQFRSFIYACGHGSDTFPERRAEADRLLALIDGQSKPDLCDLCRVRGKVRSDDEGIPFCQECWDGWQATAVQP